MATSRFFSVVVLVASSLVSLEAAFVDTTQLPALQAVLTESGKFCRSRRLFFSIIIINNLVKVVWRRSIVV